MKIQVQAIKKHGYDICLKAWADGKPTDGFMLIVWKPGELVATCRNYTGPNPRELLKKPWMK